MAQIPANRGNPQASDIAVQNSLPHIGSLSREDGQTVFNLIDNQLAKVYEDRNTLLTGGVVSYNIAGDTLTFTNDLNLEINSLTAGGSPLVIPIVLSGGTKTVSADGKMIYAIIDRSTSTAVVVDDASTLPTQSANSNEVFLIAKRRDDGLVPKVYFRNGFTISANQTATLDSPDDFTDTSFSVVDVNNNTIKFKVDVTGTTNTSTTLQTTQTADRILVLPDISDTLVSRTTTDTGADRLQNKDLDDSTTYFVDSADVTKRLKFDITGTASTDTVIQTVQTDNRIITLPDATDTLVGRQTDDTQVNRLKNKDLDDSTTALVDSVDTTVKVKFDVGGTTNTSTTFVSSQTVDRTINIPDADGTILLSSGTQDISTTGTLVVDYNGPLNAARITQSGSGNALVVEDSTNPDSTPFVITNDGRVGIGNTPYSSATNLTIDKTITGNAYSYNVYNKATIAADVTGAATGFASNLSTEASSFNLGYLTHFGVFNGQVSAPSTVNTQYGFYVDQNMQGATYNYGFWAGLSNSAPNTWNFYADSVAPNYFAGNVGIGTTTPSSKLEVATNSADNAVKITQSGSGNCLVVEDQSGDGSPFVIDASGNIIAGASAVLTGYGHTPKFQIVGNTTDTSSLLLQSTDRASGYPVATFANAASSNNGAVLSGDTLGELAFYGGDGVGTVRAASISTEVDGSPGASDMPGRIVFKTSADGTSSPVERLRIDSSGNIDGKTTQGATIPLLKGVEIEDVINVEPSLDLQFTNEAGFPAAATFTRNSVAKYYDGKTTTKSEENLLKKSESFNAFEWFASNISVTIDAAIAPNQTTTADMIGGLSGTSFKRLEQQITNPPGLIGTYTFSVFAKANTHNFIQLLYNGSGNSYANFDISTGTVGNSSAGATASIISVGNGWYRCSLTSTLLNEISAIVALVDSNTAARQALTATTNNLYLWGTQLEERSTLTNYVPTDTKIIRKFTPTLLEAAVDTPRINYDPITSTVKGLLMEKSSANVCLYSEDFSNATWTKTRSSVYSNYMTAPDGTQSADKLVEDATASNTHFVSQSISLAASTPYTISIFAKAAERSEISLAVYAASGFFADSSVSVNLNNGTAIVTGSGATGGAIAVGNGWYRIYLTQTTSAIAGSKFFNILLSNAGSTSYTGNNYSGVYIWGSQVEVKTYISSYIKTTTATVNRPADLAVMSGISFTDWFKQEEGSFYLEAGTENTVLFTVSEIVKIQGISGEEIYASRAFSSLDTEIGVKLFGNSQAFLNDTPNNLSNFKLAFGYALDNFASSTDGRVLVTDTNGTLPIVNTFYIGGTNSGDYTLDGHIKRIIYWPERLSNDILQTITALS